MNRKKKLLVSSTPHPEGSRLVRPSQLMKLFEIGDIQCSPIKLTSQPDLPKDPQPKPPSLKPKEAEKKRTVRKRGTESKEKAAPESASAKLFKEFGLDAKDIGNNALSQSRNLYNMFPEPIVLDSDEEETVVSKKPVKKPRQDSKVVESSESKRHEDKKQQEQVPGSSRISRLTRTTVGRKLKKPSLAEPVGKAPTTSQDPGIKHVTKSKPASDHKGCPKTKPVTKSKPPGDNNGSPSVMILDNDDSSFPVYEPGTSIFRNSRIKRKENHRFSLELDEKFPIEWNTRPKKAVDNVAEKVAKAELGGLSESEDDETNNNTIEAIQQDKVSKRREIDDCVVNEDGKKFIKREKEVVKKSNKKEVVSNESNHRLTCKFEVLFNSQQKCSDKENMEKYSHAKEEEGNPVLISRFEDIIFKKRKTNEGGIIARCLKTEQNDIGYLEVPANEVFSGNKINTTFVVIEGKAKVSHLGEQHTMSPGDMINITDGSGYEFTALDSNHVRFLYVKELI